MAAPTITRTPLVDDDGTLTTGTVWNNAWLTALYNAIDAVIAAEDATAKGVAQGGTGVAALAAHGVVVGEGTAPVAVVGPGTAGQVLTSNGGAADPSFQNPIGNDVCDGRLTVTSGTPITAADVAGATSIFWTPYKGKYIALYDGVSAWATIAFAETALALGTLTSGLPYDVFAFNNAGTLALEKLAWTNGTTRATALVLQDGVLVKAGAPTRRYLGSFYTTSTTTTEDSATKRLLWNYYNRVKRSLARTAAVGSWQYTGSFRQANGDPGNQVDVMIGVSEATVSLWVVAFAANTVASAINTYGLVSMGVDSTTAAQMHPGTIPGYWYLAGIPSTMFGRGEFALTAGHHFIAWLENANVANGGTVTWYRFDPWGGNGAAGMTGFFEG
jgi:hypothetical protein